MSTPGPWRCVFRRAKGGVDDGIIFTPLLTRTKWCLRTDIDGKSQSFFRRDQWVELRKCIVRPRRRTSMPP